LIKSFAEGHQVPASRALLQPVRQLLGGEGRQVDGLQPVQGDFGADQVCEASETKKMEHRPILRIFNYLGQISIHELWGNFFGNDYKDLMYASY
jgi:hypothetical protein